MARLPDLRSEARIDSLLSREAFFLLNNLVLVGLCLVIMWGTFFPLISEALTGTEASVGPPWFDRLTTPLALVLVLLTGIGPVLAWRRVTPSGAASASCACPSRSRSLALAALLALTDASESLPSLVMFTFVAFVLSVVGAGVLARRRGSPGDDGRVVAAGAGAADRPQPAPLRRLPGARRDRGAVPRAWRRRRRSSSSATCGCRRATP